MTLLVLYREEDRTGERGEVKSGPRKKVTYQCFRALHNLKKKLPSSLYSLEVASKDRYSNNRVKRVLFCSIEPYYTFLHCIWDFFH